MYQSTLPKVRQISTYVLIRLNIVWSTDYIQQTNEFNNKFSTSSARLNINRKPIKLQLFWIRRRKSNRRFQKTANKDSASISISNLGYIPEANLKFVPLSKRPFTDPFFLFLYLLCLILMIALGLVAVVKSENQGITKFPIWESAGRVRINIRISFSPYSYVTTPFSVIPFLALPLLSLNLNLDLRIFTIKSCGSFFGFFRQSYNNDSQRGSIRDHEPSWALYCWHFRLIANLSIGTRHP